MYYFKSSNNSIQKNYLYFALELDFVITYLTVVFESSAITKIIRQLKVCVKTRNKMTKSIKLTKLLNRLQGSLS